jgi:hypothetical protein
MSEPAFKPVSLEEATAFQAIDADSLASLLKPKRKNVPPPVTEKPRIPSVPAVFVGGYLDGVRRDVPHYYAEKPILYRTINPACRPERGMPLDRLFGECSAYRVTVQGNDGAFIFELVETT